MHCRQTHDMNAIIASIRASTDLTLLLLSIAALAVSGAHRERPELLDGPPPHRSPPGPPCVADPSVDLRNPGFQP